MKSYHLDTECSLGIQAFGSNLLFGISCVSYSSGGLYIDIIQALNQEMSAIVYVLTCSLTRDKEDVTD